MKLILRKKLITILFVIICVLSILFVIFNKENKGNEENKNMENKDNIEIENEDEIENTSISAVEINCIKNCISNYINTVNINSSSYYSRNENGDYVKAVSDDEIKEKIYKLLSKKYIQENNITNDNIYSYVDNITQKLLFDIVDMKYYKNNESNQYVVYGILQDTMNNFISDVYYIVNIDEENKIFSIEPVLNNQMSIDEIEVGDTLVEENEQNKIYTSNMTQEDICKEYFNTFKRILLAKPEEAFKLLDEEYRNIKFKNLDNFKDYATNKRKILKGIRLERYYVYEKEDYTQYNLIDQYSNYYIIKETKFMEYTVMLDNYTIGLPEVIDEYNSSTALEKAKLNIAKFITAINNQDYIYAYNRLDETYRNNNFNTLEVFEKYLQENFYTNNSVSIKNSVQKGTVYVIDVVITNEDNQAEQINKTLIIKMLEGFDFVMSFNLE